jgi:hypothetical protein
MSIPTSSKQTQGPTRLSDLEAAEISLVPEGANKRRFLIYKTGGGGMGETLREKIAKADPEVLKKVDGLVRGYFSGVNKDALTTGGRKHIAPENFALPETKGYPIHDISHARNALARASGKPEEAKVKSAVYAKYPSLKPDVIEKGGPGSGPRPGQGGTGDRKEHEKLLSVDAMKQMSISEHEKARNDHEQKAAQAERAGDKKAAEYHKMAAEMHGHMGMSKTIVNPHDKNYYTGQAALINTQLKHSSYRPVMKSKAVTIAKAASEAPEQPAPPTVDTKDQVTPEPDPQTGEDGLDQQTHAALMAVSRILTPFKEKLPPELVHSVMDALGFVAGGEEEMNDKPMPGANKLGDGRQREGEPLLGQDEDDGDESVEKVKAFPQKVESDKDDFLGDGEERVNKAHLADAADAADGAYREHLEKLGYRQYPDARMAMKTKGGSPVMKRKGESVHKSSDGTPDLSGVDPNTRKILEGVYKSQAELVKKNSELTDQLKNRDAADRKKEIVAKASSLGHVGIPTDDLVAQLEVADKAGKEHYERVCKSFDALNEQGRTSRIFSEYGTDKPFGAGHAAGDSMAKLDALASGLVQKDGKLTKEQAFAKVLETTEGQRLYAEHQHARGGI